MEFLEEKIFDREQYDTYIRRIHYDDRDAVMYEKMLHFLFPYIVEERGIEYTKVSEINFDYENGYVIRVSPDPGSEIDLDSDEVLTIYYADNPEETTEEPTEAPTEEPTEEPTEALADNPEEPVNNDSQAVVE